MKTFHAVLPSGLPFLSLWINFCVILHILCFVLSPFNTETSLRGQVEQLQLWLSKKGRIIGCLV